MGCRSGARWGFDDWVNGLSCIMLHPGGGEPSAQATEAATSLKPRRYPRPTPPPLSVDGGLDRKVGQAEAWEGACEWGGGQGGGRREPAICSSVRARGFRKTGWTEVSKNKRSKFDFVPEKDKTLTLEEPQENGRSGCHLAKTLSREAMFVLLVRL